jgi:hypothetical protein
MRFHRNVGIEQREYLAKELKDYEQKAKMSIEERRESHKWVSAGNSVHGNPDYLYI